MALQEKNSPSASAQKDGGISLRPASLLAAGIVFIAAVSLAYVGGVMSGRSLVENAPCVPLACDSGKNVSGGGEGGDKGQKAEGILSAEELEFSRALRSDGQMRPRQQPPPAQANPQAARQQKTGGTDGAVAGTIPSVQPPESPFAPAVPPGVTPPPAAMHDYVFQVAALKGEDNVDALRQRLEGRGLRTRMKREGKLFLVLVMLRGDNQRAAEVTQTVESMHLGRPILVSRKPVMP